ncbi:uncharacterized protein C8R40DRAFT_515393 [Lentinula edodes]|uniref:uncharacterized protein n=1 Tax=Lentinula edodes TaxID=5353 RepID=UPI001E8E9CA7|nr:uncharacterized protein C8R40DRAFT_515393 [Lentinula edodes]KAH7871966.1 hypothetical protein C8R40DRAFT_515393 [Lentinula edodes]
MARFEEREEQGDTEKQSSRKCARQKPRELSMYIYRILKKTGRERDFHKMEKEGFRQNIWLGLEVSEGGG